MLTAHQQVTRLQMLAGGIVSFEHSLLGPPDQVMVDQLGVIVLPAPMTIIKLHNTTAADLQVTVCLLSYRRRGAPQMTPGDLWTIANVIDAAWDEYYRRYGFPAQPPREDCAAPRPLPTGDQRRFPDCTLVNFDTLASLDADLRAVVEATARAVGMWLPLSP